jgi:hypothetical protein
MSIRVLVDAFQLLGGVALFRRVSRNFVGALNNRFLLPDMTSAKLLEVSDSLT